MKKWIFKTTFTAVISIIVTVLGHYSLRLIDSRFLNLEKSVERNSLELIENRNQIISIRNTIGDTQSINNSGSFNNSFQTKNEIKPDFKFDSESSKIASARLEEGLQILNNVQPCGTNRTDYQKFQASFLLWLNQTASDLSKISHRASLFFSGTNRDQGAIGLTYAPDCSADVIRLQQLFAKYVDSLREVVKGL